MSLDLSQILAHLDWQVHVTNCKSSLGQEANICSCTCRFYVYATVTQHKQQH